MDPDFHVNEDENALSVLVEPEVPDPFIVDDGEDDEDDSGDDDHSDQGEEGDGQVEEEELSDESPAAEDNIALAQSTILEAPVVLPNHEPPPSPNINKDVPPTPLESPPSEEEDEEEPPELYLPGLIIPTMFLPIPNVRLDHRVHLRPH